MKNNDNNNLEKKFEIMKFFDDARWNINNNDDKNNKDINKNYNYYWINTYESFYDGISDNVKKVKDREMLLHLITYIAERGSDFRPIWDKGSYVYSYYLKKYFENNDSDIVQKIFEINGDYLKETNYKGKKSYKWYAPKDKSNERLKKYFTDNEDSVYYISRYYIADYVNAIFTLSVLNEYDKSILNFLDIIAQKTLKEYENGKIEIKNNETKEEVLIKGLAFALYCLTYSELKFEDLSKYKFDGISLKLNNEKNDICEWYKILFEKNECENHKNKLEEIINKNFATAYNAFYGMKHEFSNLKRVWCVLRDYIKDSRYNKAFKDFVLKDINNIDIKNLVKYLELPGDVWNNNSTFGECVFNEEFKSIKKEYNEYFNKTNKNEKYTLNRLLRYLWKTKEIPNCYPEQFDCTFNFVPRMCDSINDNCRFCPFSQYSEDKQCKISKEDFEENFNKLCVCDKTKNCTISMICCGYDSKCLGEDCPLRKTLCI